MKKNTWVIFSALILAACFITAAQAQSTREYRIGPKDLLDISVFQQEDLSREVRVSEEGYISLPLIGSVKVDGLTISEVEQHLADLLEKDVLQNAQVTVLIKEHQSKRISLLGAVQNPGFYPVIGRLTIMQAISEAGGLTDLAGKVMVVIRPLPDGTSTSLRISIDGLILEGDPTLNIPLQPGDIVNIPIDKEVNIYVFGQVRNAGAHKVLQSHIPTLLQAIAQAGGFSERAKKSGVLIKRINESGEEEEIKVNVGDILKGKIKDPQLKENDTVYVPESIF